MVQSPYNVMKMDSVSVSQDSQASVAMSVLLDLKGTNVTNALQSFLDTQIAKVSNFKNFISYIKQLYMISF